MTYLDNPPVRGRSSPWSELTRRCSQKRHVQKRYWCFWIVAVLFPFTMLRMAYLCSMSSVKEQLSGISVVMMESEERSPHNHPPIISSGSKDTGLNVKPSILQKGSHIRTEEVSWTTLRERVSIENSQPKSFGKKERTREASRLKERLSLGQSLGQQLDVSQRYLRLPKRNEKINSAAFVMDTEIVASMAPVIAEKKEDRQQETQEKRQDEKPNDEHPAFAGNTAEERQDIEAEDHFTVAEVLPAKEEILTRSASEEKPAAHRQADEPKGVNEPGEAQEREGKNEKPMEIRKANQAWTAEEHKWKDDTLEAQQEEVAAEKETEQRMEEGEQKDFETIEEKREEEELKNAAGMEREMIEEQQIQATEQEEKHEDGGSVIQEVTDQTHGELPEKAEPAGECDIFEGDWVWDPEGPLYTNSTCFYMQLAQNCMSNGRPDADYLHWKWKPRDCDLPRFDARAFLEAFKGKTIGFVGDSLARNQMQSLLCMLSQIEIPKLIYQSQDDATVRWLYEQHQVTLRVLWSPYLLKESNEGVMGFEKGQSVLYLDELDIAWTSVMQDLDIMVLSVGQWYFKGSIYVKQEEVVGCHYCPGFNVTQMAYQEAYQGAVRQVLERVASEFSGIVIMSTFAISHFEDGPWDNGGHCTREMPLDKEEGVSFPGLHNDMHDIVMSEFNSIAYDKSKLNENVKLEFLDVTKVSLRRADGHPGPYRRANPYEGKDPNGWVPNDCLHWCLPGPVDTWNQLLVKLVHRHL